MEKVFRVINELVISGAIETYAIGGAVAAIFYTEPIFTDDLDIFIPVAVESHGLVTLSPLYEHLASLGYHPRSEFVEIEGWSVQFLPVPDQLTEEGVSKARVFDIEGQQMRVLPPEHLVAIALKTGRAKDFARIKSFDDSGKVDWEKVTSLVERFGLEGQWKKYQAVK